MNVYDFDDTIYDGDSSKDFIIYTAVHHPLVIIKNLPGMFTSFLLYMLGKIPKKEMKSRFFHFLSDIKDVENEVKKFWNINQSRIKTWYLKQKQKDDVIISASPEFLLKEICNRLELKHLIATQIDVNSGTICGENCKNEEKVVRFYELFPNGIIHNFYSDSKTDRYLAAKAQKAYFVKKDKLFDWDL